MAKKSIPQIKKFLQILRSADLIVSYCPMKDEPNPQSLVKLADPESFIITLEQNPLINPIDAARELNTAYGDINCAVLFIPGSAFDIFGTRHGRGLGWYDRFLHELPRGWCRIGIATDDRVHDKKLLRQTWDEPMDWLAISGADGWRMQPCTNHRVGRLRESQ